MKQTKSDTALMRIKLPILSLKGNSVINGSLQIKNYIMTSSAIFTFSFIYVGIYLPGTMRIHEKGGIIVFYGLREKTRTILKSNN